MRLSPSRRRTTGALLALAAIGAGAATTRIRAHGQDPQPIRPIPRGGFAWSGERFLAHLATDKPLYRPGETVYARAALLEAFSRVPSSQPVQCQIEVKSPRGETVFQTMTVALQGIAPFAWPVPAELAGGEYKLVASFPWNGFPSTEVAFDVRAYRVPRIDTDLELQRKAYGPGDTVTATLHAKRAEGGIPAGARVTAVATVDSVEVSRSQTTLDPSGSCSVSFALPSAIGDGEGTLALVVEDGGVQETAAKTIPIVVNRIRLETFPEGGDLVSGLETRIYFEARTPKGKPADVKGRIVDAAGVEVGTFASEHEGRGRATFTPRRESGPYALVLDEPAGIKGRFALPAVQPAGFALAAVDEATSASEPVRLRVASTTTGPARVVLSVREREIASLSLKLVANEPQTVTLTPALIADGVVRATVLDEKETPRAERLVFRRPVRELKVDVEATPTRGALREHVKLTVKTHDLAGAPVPAMVTLSAVDDAVLETVERRERAARLPVEALLGGEVRELMDAASYLEGGEKGARRTDLLLGTQGWRRFAFVDAQAFAAAQGDKGARALCWVQPSGQGIAANDAFGGEELAGAGPLMDGARFEGAPRGRGPVPQAMRPQGEVVAKGAPRPAAAPPAAPRPAPGAVDRIGVGAGKKAANGPADPGFAGKPMAARDAKDKEWGRARRQLAQPAVAVVREFAHHAEPAAKGERTDFAETLYWNAGLATNAKGEATVEFDLADSVTTFRVRSDAFGTDGALGAADAIVEARRAFYCEPKLPLEVTTGDVVEAPIAFVNGTSNRLRADFHVLPTGPITLSPGFALTRELLADERARILVPFTIGAGHGPASLRIQATGGLAEDDVARPLTVVAAGFPRELQLGGKLGDGRQHAFTIPEGVNEGSLETETTVYPSPLASLEQAVAALLREPCGCFEQTSSTNYPNSMALSYLSSHPGASPETWEKARKLVDKGYARLVSFECREKGYEWFGGAAPGHEALTAYGVLEFSDMAGAGTAVDQTMLQRTREWLLSRRDGNGGWQRNPRALDSFGGAPEDVTNAYIVWALVQAKTAGLEKEIAAIREHAQSSSDAYYLSLAANVLLETKDESAAGVVEKLAGLQEKDGSFAKAQTSITRSGGESLTIETTSLAVLALLRSPAKTDSCERAMKWLLERAKGGRFGSTQATVLALKAIVAYDAAHATPKKAGTLLLVVDGKVADEKRFAADQQGAIVLPSFADQLKAGPHTVELKLEDGTAMPYSIAIRYHALTPASSEKCQVSLRTSLSTSVVAEGETADVQVELANKTDAGLPMACAIVGLPGGLEARVDQLKELVKEGKIDFFELRGRDVVLYRRAMAPGEVRKVSLSCVAAIPGTYTGQASRAYLYYTDEEKTWVQPLQVRITPRS